MAGEEALYGSSGLATGSALASVPTGWLITIIALWVGIYVFMALAFQSIAKKSGYKRPWFAWVPILNLVMILELGGFNWAWIFLYAGSFIPEKSSLFFISSLAMIALAVLSIISLWRIFKKAGYPGALSLLMIVPIANFIVVGIVAWQKKTYKRTSKPKATVKKVATKKATKKKVVAKKPVAKKKVPSKKKK